MAFAVIVLYLVKIKELVSDGQTPFVIIHLKFVSPSGISEIFVLYKLSFCIVIIELSASQTPEPGNGSFPYKLIEAISQSKVSIPASAKIFL